VQEEKKCPDLNNGQKLLMIKDSYFNIKEEYFHLFFKTDNIFLNYILVII
jgi:hypothetical protein